MSEDSTVPWRNHVSAARHVLHSVNDASGASWRLDSRFATGVLQGAWRVRDGAEVAILKWHAKGTTAPYNPDAPAIARFLREAGYPTPRWLAWGETAEGVPWFVQDFVDGEPLAELDDASVEIFLHLVELHRALAPPTAMSWNPYMRAYAFGERDSHRRLSAAGGQLRSLLVDAIALAAPYESVELPETEMVHFDLNVSNLLVRDGELVGVVDVDGVGRGCAVYDLLSPVVNGVSWGSDPQAVERLVAHGLQTYGAGPFAIAAACLTIEIADWYATTRVGRMDERAARHRAWLADIASRIR